MIRAVAPVYHSIIYPGWRFAYQGLFKFDPFRVSFPIQLIVKAILFEAYPFRADSRSMRWTDDLSVIENYSFQFFHFLKELK